MGKKKNQTVEKEAALAGLRVLEFSSGQAGSVAGLMLAECGAEVVKLAFSHRPSRLMQAQAAIWERSKSRLSLDLATDQDRRLLETLFQGADVVVHDMIPAEAKAMGLDEEALAARHPHLIITNITGWPIGHPKQNRPVSEVLVLGEAGLLDEQAAVNRNGPVFLRFPLGGSLAAGLAVAGTIARLIQREQSRGIGPVHTSLLQGALVPQMMYWARMERPTAAAAAMPKNNPATLFQCGDGKWMHVMGQPGNAPWVREGLEAMSPEKKAQENQRYATAPVQYMPDWGATAAVLATRPRSEWLAHLWESDVPVQAVQPMGRLYQDEQARINGYIVEVDTEAFGQTLQPAVPFHIEPRPQPRDGDEFQGWEVRKPIQDSNRTENLPLGGLKVVDLGSFLAGPLTSMLLADLGAEVVKVEMTSGDPLRPAEWAFNGCQRGKRALALQLKDAAAQPILERLVSQADIVHHNLRLPAARKLGIDYDTLKTLNPKLIYSHVSAYGRHGPRKDWPGYDQLFQAASGWEYEAAGEGNPPMWHRFGMMDHLAAISSLIVTLLAVLQRQRDGCGQFVAASLLGSSLFTMEAPLDSKGCLLPRPKLDSHQLGVSPTQRLYACSDGWIGVDDVGKQEDAVGKLLHAAGVSDIAALEAQLADSTVADALSLMKVADLPTVRVELSQRDVFFDDPANIKAGLCVAYAHPQYGLLEQPGSPWNLGASPQRPPPLLGQHSLEILQELGFSIQEIAKFKARNTIASPDSL